MANGSRAIYQRHGIVTYEHLFDLVQRVTYKQNSTISMRPGAGEESYVVRLVLSMQVHNAKFPAEHPTTIALEKKLTRNELDKLTEFRFMERLRQWWTEFELHEVDEWLKLDGATFVDPHPEKRAYDRMLAHSMKNLKPWWRQILERWRATA